MTKSTQWKHPLFKPSSTSGSSRRSQQQSHNSAAAATPATLATPVNDANQNFNQTMPPQNGTNGRPNENGLNYTAPVRPSSSSGELKQSKARVKPAWNK